MTDLHSGKGKLIAFKNDSYFRPPKSGRRLFTLILGVILAGLLLTFLPGFIQTNQLKLLNFENSFKPVAIKGFYPIEHNQTNIFRWTDATAQIQLPQTLTPRKVTLEVSVPYPAVSSQPPELHLLYKGRELGSWQLTGQWLRIEAEFEGNPELAPEVLELQIENPLSPRSGDKRLLGVAIRALELEISPFPSYGRMLTLMALGLGTALVGWWLRIAPWSIFLVTLTLLLILTIYWHSNRLSATLVVGWWLMGAIILALLTLYRRPLPRLYLIRVLLPLIPPALIAGFAFVLYHNSLSYGFFSDDYHLILKTFDRR